MLYHQKLLKKYVTGDNPTYKKISTQGYVYLKYPSHRRASSELVREHVLVFEKTHNCSLLDWSAIHHIDGDRQNNDWINLEGMVKWKHSQMEMLENRNDRKCSDCGRDTVSLEFTGGINTYREEFKRPHWYGSNESGYLCQTCYKRRRKNNNIIP